MGSDGRTGFTLFIRETQRFNLKETERESQLGGHTLIRLMEFHETTELILQRLTGESVEVCLSAIRKLCIYPLDSLCWF